MSNPELANRRGEFWADDIQASLTALFDKVTAEINPDIYRRDTLQQMQGMHERVLLGSGVAEKALKTLDVDSALNHRSSTHVYEYIDEETGIKQGGVATKFVPFGEPASAAFIGYTPLYFQHDGEMHTETYDGLFTLEEIKVVHGMVEDLLDLAKSGQIAPSDDLTSHHRQLPDEPIY